MRVVVIGAGPIGIAAAVAASDRGHDVTVVERGRIGASLWRWGATRFFTPLSMNVTPRMRELLGAAFPDPSSLLTGPEYAERVLEPLTESQPLRGRVRTATAVVAIARRGLTRADYAGHPLRAERPFRLLVRERSGQESFLESDVVLDASGGLLVPRPFGPGGLPARGEGALHAAPSLIRTLGELHDRLPAIGGKRILLVGDGHSAANAIVALADAARSDPSTRIVWAFRSANLRPCPAVAADPLPERQRIVEAANALAQTPPSFLTIERRAMVESVAPGSALAVTLTNGRLIETDFLAAFTGFRPEAAYLGELEVEISPVTEGGARLARAISCITDCLSVPQLAPRDLESGEERFFFLGSRAYGRSNGFLLQTGFSQLAQVMEMI